MIDDRCVCGHDANDHDHGIDCGRCECFEFRDPNDLLDREIDSQLDRLREK